MPIYEFYCADCHRIFNFFSRAANTSKRPACPECRRPELRRKPSAFAISRGRAEPGPEGAPEMDDARLEQIMQTLARDADRLDENNPRQMAGMLRKLYDATGMELGSHMQEALRRMEAGEDPDKIEEEMGDLLEGEEPLVEGGTPGLKSLSRRLRPPSVDTALHEL
jgi:putative FmdB family regulatory protein